MVHTLTNGNLTVTHSLEQPAVYLDHWAVMDIASDRDVAARLHRAITRAKGTLVVSWINLAEFTAVADRRQGEQAEAFIDKFIPRVFFLEVDLHKRPDGGRERAPIPEEVAIADTDLLKQIVIESVSGGGQISLSGIIQTIQQGELIGHFESLAKTAADSISALAREIRCDPAKRQQGYKDTPFTMLQYNPFAFLRRELLKKVVISKGEAVTQNDAVDLFHATKAAVCCTYILLDGQWATWLSDIKRRIASAGYADPYATPFSKRRQGIADFLGAIEADI